MAITNENPHYMAWLRDRLTEIDIADTQINKRQGQTRVDWAKLHIRIPPELYRRIAGLPGTRTAHIERALRLYLWALGVAK